MAFMRCVGAGIGVALLAVGPVAARQSATLSPADSKFVRQAAVGGMAEVELGKLAAEKASTADVKQFGQRMVDDHSKANDELKALASRKSVTLPTAIDAASKATVDKLSKLSGDAFDHAYMRDMVKDHNKDVAEFRHVSTTATDADLKAWAAKTLPTLEDHQASAEAIASKFGASTNDVKPKHKSKSKSKKGGTHSY